MLGCGCSLRFGEGVEESVMEIVNSKKKEIQENETYV
jgi:hypothetical protein